MDTSRRPGEVVSFDSAVYDLDTVKKAAYRFIDKFSPDIRIEGSDIVCTLTFLQALGNDSVERILADFRREVLDQDLRQSIAAETASYRNAILALAFAPSKLQSDE